MIPQAHITEWRAKAPWASDAQIEQDLVVSRAIVEIFSDAQLARETLFRGGTALHKLFLDPPGRYSEDIDLVQAKAGPIGPLLNALRARIDPWLGRAQWKHGAGRVTLQYRFLSEIPPVTPLRLKLEINTREHFVVLPVERKTFTVVNPWFSGAAQVTTYAVEELLATKLRALYQRKKGRDLFDLVAGLQRLPGLDAGEIVACFSRYMAESAHRVSRADFERNLAEKIVDPVFTDDVKPLVVRGAGSISGTPGHGDDLTASAAEEPLDPAAALELVQRSLIGLLPGEPWKGSPK